jgi:hypothetical protein
VGKGSFPGSLPSGGVDEKKTPHLLAFPRVIRRVHTGLGLVMGEEAKTNELLSTTPTGWTKTLGGFFCNLFPLWRGKSCNKMRRRFFCSIFPL